jgi:hypothetical protein
MKTAEEIKFDLFCDRLFKYGTYAMTSLIWLGIASLVIHNTMIGLGVIR